jgi:hypothetical protein
MSIPARREPKDIAVRLRKVSDERLRRLQDAELRLGHLLITKRTLTDVTNRVDFDMLDAHCVTFPNLDNIETVMLDVLDAMIAEQQAEVVRLRADPYRASKMEAESQSRSRYRASLNL